MGAMSLCLRQRAPWFLWPFAALLDLLGGVLRLSGRVVVVSLGLVSMIVGALATATVIGAPLGVPLFVVGLMLAVRGIF
jgi:hypothetical protein